MLSHGYILQNTSAIRFSFCPFRTFFGCSDPRLRQLSHVLHFLLIFDLTFSRFQRMAILVLRLNQDLKQIDSMPSSTKKLGEISEIAWALSRKCRYFIIILAYFYCFFNNLLLLHRFFHFQY